MSDESNLVTVIFSLSIQGRIDQIGIAVNGTPLEFGAGGAVKLQLEPGFHELSWDSIGTYPAKFVVAHNPAKPSSTQRSYYKNDKRLDGVRDIEIS